MTRLPDRLRTFLDRSEVYYETIRHHPDYTALRTAQHTETPVAEFAKTVLLLVDGRPALVVEPAHHRVDLERFASEFLAQEVKLADESTFSKYFPDCEPGAAPPFGNLYGLPVYLSSELEKDERITFNAGSHDLAVRMNFEDFEILVHPMVADISAEQGAGER